MDEPICFFPSFFFKVSVLLKEGSRCIKEKAGKKAKLEKKKESWKEVKSKILCLIFFFT